MIINSKFFHYPPYISTSWKQVAALHMSGTHLVFTLLKGDLVQIPNLTPQEVEAVFKAHFDYLEKESQILSTGTASKIISQQQAFNPLAQALLSSDLTSDSPFQFGIANMDGFASALQHNQAQASLPDLPIEVIQKIASISKIIAPPETSDLPKAEPHCNCMYCQIARAITQGVNGEVPSSVEIQEVQIKQEELPFQPWHIHEKGELMYEVIDKDNPLKIYHVFLGEPMGCTCGEEGCTHLVAVLKS